MSAPVRWIPSDKPRDGHPFIPWTVRTSLPIDHPLIFLDHCWVVWFTADAKSSTRL